MRDTQVRHTIENLGPRLGAVARRAELVKVMALARGAAGNETTSSVLEPMAPATSARPSVNRGHSGAATTMHNNTRTPSGRIRSQSVERQPGRKGLASREQPKPQQPPYQARYQHWRSSDDHSSDEYDDNGQLTRASRSQERRVRNRHRPHDGTRRPVRRSRGREPRHSPLSDHCDDGSDNDAIGSGKRSYELGRSRHEERELERQGRRQEIYENDSYRGKHRDEYDEYRRERTSSPKSRRERKRDDQGGSARQTARVSHGRSHRRSPRSDGSDRDSCDDSRDRRVKRRPKRQGVRRSRDDDCDLDNHGGDYYYNDDDHRRRTPSPLANRERKRGLQTGGDGGARHTARRSHEGQKRLPPRPNRDASSDDDDDDDASHYSEDYDNHGLRHHAGRRPERQDSRRARTKARSPLTDDRRRTDHGASSSSRRERYNDTSCDRRELDRQPSRKR